VTALTAAPRDPARWLALARALLTAGEDDAAYALVDCAPAVGLGVDAARAMRHALGAPQVEALLADLTAAGPPALSASAWVEVCPSAPRALLGSSAQGWAIFDWPDTLTPTPCVGAASHCVWLDADTLLCADDAALWVASASAGAAPAPSAQRMRLPGPCRGLLRLSVGCVVVEVAAGPSPRAHLWRRGAAGLTEVESVHGPLRACAPWGDDGLICYGGGVQATEVRFASLDGGWQVKAAHSADVRLVLPSPSTPRLALSIDASGEVLRWSGERRRARALGHMEARALPPRHARWRGVWDEARAQVIAAADPSPSASSPALTPLGVCFAPLPSAGEGLEDPPQPRLITTLRWVAPFAHPWAALAQDHAGRWRPFDLRDRAPPPAWRIPLALLTHSESAALTQRLSPDARALLTRPAPPLPPWLRGG
jgi:hypothetical protein